MNGNLDILNTLLSIDLVRRAIRRYFNYRGYNPETLEYIKRMVTPRRLLNFISYLFAHRFGIFIFEHQPHCGGNRDSEEDFVSFSRLWNGQIFKVNYLGMWKRR